MLPSTLPWYVCFIFSTIMGLLATLGFPFFWSVSLIARKLLLKRLDLWRWCKSRCDFAYRDWGRLLSPLENAALHNTVPRLKLKYLRLLFEPLFNPPLWNLPFLLGAYLIAPNTPMHVGTCCPYFIFQVLILMYTLELEKKSLKTTYIYFVF